MRAAIATAAVAADFGVGVALSVKCGGDTDVINIFDGEIKTFVSGVLYKA